MNDTTMHATIGVFGGSGLYTFLPDTESVTLDTPWGSPSAPVTIGSVGGTRVAFLPRHGPGHELPPHRVNYRANVDAMRRLGVHTVLAPFAAGSLQPDIRPGEFVVVDQLVDRTSGRADTFHDRFDDGPQHVSLADPYDAGARAALLHAGRETGVTMHDGGTVVVVNGPRFATRAESAWHRSAGWHVVNMTQYPEAALAREAGIAFGGVALVTDFDAGLEDDPAVEPVTQEQVFDVFRTNIARVRDLLMAAIPRVTGS
ncbi:S-methyl-5'-thioadenosine phosphorylase [Haloactinopolyspora alba]|uniref:S-methyl-5'-thioadenosine phosphorylase n=1 Tax=Haloactinopolyspora alba TaxID=648780 RepID=UPI00197A829B|nr:S-methyl-5'-thioadenosine phosphorylase [Haloactinopolyspora alba]